MADHFKRIYIEITNTCNLNCSFCDKNKRTPHAMSVEEFSHVINEVKDYADTLLFHVQGEPLMHPEIETFLTICDAHHLKVNLVTNGSFLQNHPGLASHPSLYKVSFSMQSCEARAKEEVVPWLENILSFAQTASDAHHPFVELRFWRTDQNDLENTAYCLKTIRNRYPLTPGPRPNQSKVMNYVRMDTDNEFDWPDTLDHANNTEGTCHGAIDQIAILSNGTVVPCCLDANERIPLGNIFEMSLSEILNSKRYQAMVSGFRKHYLSEEFCRKCTYRLRFSKK